MPLPWASAITTIQRSPWAQMSEEIRRGARRRAALVRRVVQSGGAHRTLQDGRSHAALLPTDTRGGESWARRDAHSAAHHQQRQNIASLHFSLVWKLRPPLRLHVRRWGTRRGTSGVKVIRSHLMEEACESDSVIPLSTDTKLTL